MSSSSPCKLCYFIIKTESSLLFRHVREKCALPRDMFCPALWKRCATCSDHFSFLSPRRLSFPQFVVMIDSCWFNHAKIFQFEQIYQIVLLRAKFLLLKLLSSHSRGEGSYEWYLMIGFIFPCCWIIHYLKDLCPLKRQTHEILCFRFFSWTIFPEAPDYNFYNIRVISNFSENSRRYSQFKLHRQNTRHCRDTNISGNTRSRSDVNNSRTPATEEKPLAACLLKTAWTPQSEPVFLNVYGTPESIPRNEFR